MFTCEFGCVRNGKPIPINTLRGWKHHMTHAHGQWTDEQLQKIVGNGQEGTRVTGHGSLEEYAKTLPEDAARLGEEPSTTVTESPSSGAQATAAPAEPKVRKVTAGMKKFRKMVNEIPKSFFRGQGIEPSEEEQNAIDEAMDFLQELFGIAIEVSESNFIIRSRFIALLYPLTVLLFVFFKHKAATIGDVEKIRGTSGNGRKREDVGSGQADESSAAGGSIRIEG
jgi:hypothetical protein